MKIAPIRDSDHEKLFKIVHAYPFLYDTQHPDHKDALQTKNVWICVSKAMGDAGKNDDFWKKRWRYQRDQYVRKRREIKTKSGEVAIKAARWKFMEELSFLDPFLVDAPIQSDLKHEGNEADSLQGDGYAMDMMDTAVDDCDDDHGDDDDQHNASHYEREQQLLHDNSSQNASESDCEESMPKPRRGNDRRNIILHANALSASTSKQSLNTSRQIFKRCSRTANNGKWKKMKKNRMMEDSFEKAIINVYEQQKKATDERDEIDSFFESCTLRVRKLTPQFRSFVQYQISQILFNAENPQMQQPLMQLPVSQQPASPLNAMSAPISPTMPVQEQIFENTGDGCSLSNACIKLETLPHKWTSFTSCFRK